jgi:hypothetical protein
LEKVYFAKRLCNNYWLTDIRLLGGFGKRCKRINKNNRFNSTDSINRHFPKWYYAAFAVGWVASSLERGTQTYTATQTGKIDLQIMFDSVDYVEVACRLDFYENSSSITKTKYLILQ